MRIAILFALLASVVVAVPATHKRECTRKHGHGHRHQGAQNGTAPAADPAVADPMPSPSAIAAVALANGAGNANVDSNTNGRGGGRGKGGSSQAVHSASSTSRVGSPSASKAPVVVSSASKEPVVVPSASRSTSRSTSKAAPAPTSSAASTPSPSAGGGNTARSTGAGLAINGQSVKSFSGFLKGNLGWYTGWADTPLSGTDGLEWVPQVWGASDVDGVKAAASKWPSSVKSVLSFNEPDMGANVGGSNIDARTAATKHIQWVKDLGGNYQIGAPGVARGSTKWMDDWVAACGGQCKYDFVPFHFYGTNPNELIAYAKDFHTRYGKPLWVTEWSCIDYGNGHVCTDAEVRTFMKTAVDWFKGDGADIVHRWAYFGAFADMASGGNANGLENKDGSINAMGQYYISL